MIITKIESQKNPDRVNIYIDGNFAFGILKEIELKYTLHENMEIDQTFIEEVLLEEEKLKARNKALSLLSYRSRSTREIIDKLLKDGFEDPIIKDTINFLRDYNLIDDSQYAKSFMKDKVRLNKYGPNRIRLELYKKGIPKEMIEDALDEYPDEYHVAYDLAIKKMKTYKRDDQKVLYGKLGRFLEQKGFSYDCIRKVLKDILE